MGIRLEVRVGGALLTPGFQGNGVGNKAPLTGLQLPEESASVVPPLISQVPVDETENNENLTLLTKTHNCVFLKADKASSFSSWSKLLLRTTGP